MGLCGKEENKQILMKCDGKSIFDLFAYCPNNISKLCPLIQSCELVGGQFGSVGCIISWTFTVDGKTITAKEMMTVVDEENQSIQFKIIEGDVLQEYKSFLTTVQSTNNSVSFSVEFEKMNEGIPNPTALVQFLDKVVQDIDINYQIIPKLATN